MTPLHVLLNAAVERAQTARSSLTWAEVARAAGIEKGNLYRAREACSADTLGKVLAAVEQLVGLKLDVALVETPPGQPKSSHQASTADG